MIIYDDAGKDYRVAKKLAEGGEGEIYQLENSHDMLFKQYLQPSLDHEQKIRHLSQLTSLPGSDAVALPVSPAFVRIGNPQQSVFAGFLMPYVQGGESLFTYLSPRERTSKYPHITTLHMYAIARNLAAQIEMIHGWGHTVIGDLNYLNVLVLPDMRISIIDFDSVQYTNGRVYPCTVGMPEFIPPEGRAEDGKITQAYDLFALAVLIFQLLRMGDYPYRAKLKLPIEKPQTGLFLKNKGIYPYIENAVAEPPARAMPYSWLEPELRAAFNRTFGEGSKSPEKRTSASDWKKILHQSMKRLQTCSKHPNFQYGYHLNGCPWCETLP